VAFESNISTKIKLRDLQLPEDYKHLSGKGHYRILKKLEV
jgi:hypothetical protein